MKPGFVVLCAALAATFGTGHAATVLVTGADRGLGLEFTRQYAARGDIVIATCRLCSAAFGEVAGPLRLCSTRGVPDLMPPTDRPLLAIWMAGFGNSDRLQGVKSGRLERVGFQVAEYLPAALSDSASRVKIWQKANALV